jgi:hypothetical protein
MTTKLFDQIIAILTEWLINEEYEYDVCLQKLMTAGLDEDTAWAYMDACNFMGVEKKGIANALTDYIEEQEQLEAEAAAEGFNYCGHDLIIDTW